MTGAGVSGGSPRVVLLSLAEVERERDALAAGLAGLGLDVVIAREVPSGAGIVALVVLPSVEVTAAHAEALPDLRVVCAASTGLDHLDVAGLRAAGCVVTNAEGHSDIEVADHTIAMIAAMLRGLATYDAEVRAGVWDSRAGRVTRITGTTLGLVGFGRIAQLVARRAVGLGMIPAAWSRSRSAGVDAATGVELVGSLPELLARSQVVSLHVPQTALTLDLIDDDAFDRMPDGSYLVNCSRGGLVDIAALGRALRRGRVAAAALDVLDTEPPGAGHPALALPRTILTPHAAWLSASSATAAYELAATSIRSVLAGPDSQEHR